MDNQFDKPSEVYSEAEKTKVLRDSLRLAEQQGDESEVLRLENEIRTREAGVESSEDISANSQEVIATQEQLPNKEALAEEILANVEELGTNIEKKDPKFYSEKARVLLLRIGQIAGGTLAVAGAAGFVGMEYEALNTWLEMTGPIHVPSSANWSGQDFSPEGEAVAIYYNLGVISLGLSALAGGAVALAEGKIGKIKEKMNVIKQKYQLTS